MDERKREEAITAIGGAKRRSLCDAATVSTLIEKKGVFEGAPCF